jgi:hypothetical protein
MDLLILNETRKIREEQLQRQVPLVTAKEAAETTNEMVLGHAVIRNWLFFYRMLGLLAFSSVGAGAGAPATKKLWS